MSSALVHEHRRARSDAGARDQMLDGGPNRYYFDGLFAALEKFVESKAQEAA